MKTPIPIDLQEALEDGELSQEQLRQLISIEAAALGLTFAEAVTRARRGTLPKDPIGSDIQFLVMLLADGTGAAEASAAQER